MNLSITDDITFRKLTILMMLVEKGNAEALNTLEENVRGPLFVHKGLLGTRPGIKITVAVGSTGTEACVM
ncbi:LysR family transcriptional regulator [Salmonella enterica subsp. enterica serovar Newport]|nr:LysR family transcriptional regulator [Salmonella enterica subsp. enterica]EBX1370054.1 LysR family transcriptional regulator [Salmonella enterica subsp. enterica serovar Newport]ECE7568784.1 LysR family transcriptional regulator [Salmonella enterica subsp. enterica serovar Kinondoni]EKO1888458.1 LysR family transcriptional regulator [Salmonella enterica]EBZ4057907.1 LysR family transcriptional regulator [Salmonella enterica subsp. enterica serovar Newport]